MIPKCRSTEELDDNEMRPQQAAATEKLIATVRPMQDMLCYNRTN